MSVTPKSFYGGPQDQQSLQDRSRLKRLQRAEEAVRSDTRATRRLNKKPKLLEDERTYKVFNVQSEAIMAASENPDENLKVFSFETGEGGKRHFKVCTAETAYEVLDSFKPDRRHLYEVIPQFWPCKLYFDLEFNKAANPDLSDESAEQALQSFIDLVKGKLSERFGVRFGSQDVLDLDSGTKEKFSRHLIFKKPIFEDNFEAGCFVQELCNNFSSSEKQKFSFFNKTGETSKALFIDNSVYSKNRNFRTHLSSKKGKTAILKLSKPCLLSKLGQENADEKSIFLDSLVTNIGSGQDKLINVSGTEKESKKLKTFQSSFKQSNSNNQSATRESAKSTFPEIDKFIESLISKDNGYIRKTTLNHWSKALEYEIAGGYRFCENVKRHHKSNNIKFVALLSSGKYLQLCHDQDCKDFTSTQKDLPSEALPWLAMFEDEHDTFDEEKLFDTEDDEILCEAANLALESQINDNENQNKDLEQKEYDTDDVFSQDDDDFLLEAVNHALSNSDASNTKKCNKGSQTEELNVDSTNKNEPEDNREKSNDESTNHRESENNQENVFSQDDDHILVEAANSLPY